MTDKKRVPWLRLNVTAYQDPAVRLARCGAVYPWVLTQVKIHGNGRITREALHHDLAAIDLNIPPELAKEQLDGMFARGLCTEAADGTVSVKSWSTYQPDNRPHSSERKPRRRRSIKDPPPPVPAVSPGDSPGAPGEVPGNPGADSDNDGDENPTPPTPVGVAGLVYDGYSEADLEASVNETRIVDGVVHYTARAVHLQLVRQWPDEWWHKTNHHRFSGEICAFPKDVVDAAFAEVRLRKYERPWPMKKVCESLERRGVAKPQVDAEAGRKAAVQQQVERLRRNDRELRTLIEECIAAKVAPPMPIRELIVERLLLWNERVPPLFTGELS